MLLFQFTLYLQNDNINILTSVSNLFKKPSYCEQFVCQVLYEEPAY